MLDCDIYINCSHKHIIKTPVSVSCNVTQTTNYIWTNEQHHIISHLTHTHDVSDRCHNGNQFIYLLQNTNYQYKY